MTLTTVAILTKRLIFITVVLLILGSISLIGYNIWHARYLALLPAPVELPDTKFGILSSLDLPSSSVSPTNFSYSVDTVDGFLPKFKNIQKVFFSPKSYSTFLASEKAKKLAEKFNLQVEPEVLSETRHRFTLENKSLTVELDSGNFIYNNQASMSAQPLPSQEILTGDFRDFLSQLGTVEQLKSGPVKVNLQDGKAQISIWPANIEDKQILTPLFTQSLITTTVIGSPKNIDNILSLKYKFFPIDSTTFATYPIKTTESALADLKSGKGKIVIAPAKPQVSITSAYLTYYQSENYTPYVQPIFVFEGPNFVAYVPAIIDEFLSPATQSSNKPTQ